ncbi:uncharacterized protein METZ01_LOCUS18605 [marine metagenome]|uniref:Uncharacterized protein n=1 Tax=marine metagenome TaxID=408172 RepID=A0A381PFF7_9ZZZZ
MDLRRDALTNGPDEDDRNIDPDAGF